MLTLISIVILFTIVKWVKMWDKSIKQKKHILEFFPKNNLSAFLLILTTIFTSIVTIVLILLYLP